MTRISKHSKLRIIERDNDATSISEAKKIAKIAFNSGHPIGEYQKYPKFFAYLQKKNNQTYDCVVKIYRGNLYIWKSRKHKLVTVHPIPDRFIKEMEKNEAVD